MVLHFALGATRLGFDLGHDFKLSTESYSSPIVVVKPCRRETQQGGTIFHSSAPLRIATVAFAFAAIVDFDILKWHSRSECLAPSNSEANTLEGQQLAKTKRRYRRASLLGPSWSCALTCLLSFGLDSGG